MYEGAHVASIMSVPLFTSLSAASGLSVLSDFLPTAAEPSELPLSFLSCGSLFSESCFALFSSSRMSFMNWLMSRSMRFLKATSVLASNGGVSWYPGSPMKYWRYGFSVISSTSSLSEKPKRFWIISAPRAILHGFATFPVSLMKREAYFSSYSSHGMSSASLIQRFSGFMCIPSGWLKSKKEYSDLSFALYTILMLRG